MSTDQTITITHTAAYIIFTYSASAEVIRVPKDNLTIKYVPKLSDNPRLGRVYLNWPAGNHSKSLGFMQLSYLNIASPSVASDTELVDILESYVMSSLTDNGKILVFDKVAHTDDICGIEIRVNNTIISTWTDEDSNNLVTTLGLTGKNLMITDGKIYIPDGRRNASITLSQGSVWLLK